MYSSQRMWYTKKKVTTYVVYKKEKKIAKNARLKVPDTGFKWNLCCDKFTYESAMRIM